MIDFSICIPTHRIGPRLINTLRSLEYLDYPREKIQVCVFFDGVDPSNHFTDLIPHIDKNRFCEGPPHGVAFGKNNALALGDAPWRVLLDGDDFLVPTALKQYSNWIEKHPDTQLGAELAVLNILDKEGAPVCLFPSAKEQFWYFYKKTINHCLKTVGELPGFGRPILFKNDTPLRFRTNAEPLEERVYLCDLWNSGIRVDIFPGCSYLYNWNPDGVTGGTPENWLKIYNEKTIEIRDQIGPRYKPLIRVADTVEDVHPTWNIEQDAPFIEKVLAWERELRTPWPPQS
jgi:hypothetical protein